MPQEATQISKCLDATDVDSLEKSSFREALNVQFHYLHGPVSAFQLASTAGILRDIPGDFHAQAKLHA
jgi:hypothetical protein